MDLSNGVRKGRQKVRIEKGAYLRESVGLRPAHSGPSCTKAMYTAARRVGEMLRQPTFLTAIFSGQTPVTAAGW